MVKFVLVKCKTKASYKARLEQKGKLNLDKVKKKFDVLFETPILLIINVENIEILVHGFGELLFKKCEDLELMEKLAEKIYEVGLE